MWKIGKIAGIDCSIHWTLVAMILWTGLVAPAGGALGATLLISAIFGCVLLHELGHSMAARQVGIETSSIVLLPIGGVATLARMPRNPLHELWIAIAGPLVNVVIASVLYLGMHHVAATAPSMLGWFTYLMYANLSLVLFNLIPAFPMDGGRVLRAVLACRLPYLTATNTAATVGQFVALGLALLGAYQGHWMLVMVAGFVYLAGRAEVAMVVEEASSFSDPITDSVRNFARRANLSQAGSFVTKRAGRTMHVIWDERERRYRCASVT